MSTMAERRAYGEFVCRALQSAGAGVSFVALADACAELWHIAEALHRWAERDCNQGLTPAEQARVTRLEERGRAVAAGIGAGVVYNGDPRGFAVYVQLKDGASNSWDTSRGWGIG